MERHRETGRHPRREPSRLKDKELDYRSTVDDDATLEGRVELHETATVEAGAVICSPVSITEYTVIGSGSYVGPYTSIGANLTLENVQPENSVVISDFPITTSGNLIDSLLGRG